MAHFADVEFVDDAKLACGAHSDCINRLLFIECSGDSCPAGDFCQNQNFRKRNYAPMEIFLSGGKGFGLRANVDYTRFLSTQSFNFVRRWVDGRCALMDFISQRHVCD